MNTQETLTFTNTRQQPLKTQIEPMGVLMVEFTTSIWDPMPATGGNRTLMVTNMDTAVDLMPDTTEKGGMKVIGPLVEETCIMVVILMKDIITVLK